MTLAREFRLTGRLLGDRSEQAIVLLGASSGGSGERVYLAVVGRARRGIENLATTRVGDRVQVRDARIEGRRIVLDLIEAGPHDALCCPGDLVERTWQVSDRILTEGTAEPMGRLTLQVVAGTEWVLTHWSWDDRAPDGPAVTLRYEDGRFSGRSGCNAYAAPVHAGEPPGRISIGPAAVTRGACPPAEMEVEARFLRQLGGVTRFEFVAGQLALDHEAGGVRGVMLFRRKGP